MNNLILQVAAMNKHNSNEQTDDVEPQRPRNAKRKAGETNALKGNGSGKDGKWIKIKRGEGKKEHWTHPSKFGFPKMSKDSPFNDLEILWDSNWPADKKAYYNARKKVQTEAKANWAANKANRDAADKVVEVKREPTKAQKIAALKKELEDLEK